MNKKENLKKEILKIIKKGEDALRGGEVLLTERLPDQASGRAYYAVFHFMQAALLTKGLSYSKHSGVLSGFSEHFIKINIFPKEFAGKIRSLKKDREVGDYGYTRGINCEEAEDDLETAKKIVGEIKKYLLEFIENYDD